MPQKTDFRRDAKVLLFDLEISPTLSWNYGQYQTNALKVEQPPILLSFAWKWLGDKNKPQCLTLYDKPGIDKFDHNNLVRELWRLMDECEILVAHNINFDQKMANSFFLRAGLNPPSWYKPFCTLKTARKYFKLDNNKLDYLGRLLFDDGKTSVTHADVWYDLLFAKGRKQKNASKKMAQYNIQDVVLLEKIYNRLLSFADNHPNMALASGNECICPRCGNSYDFRVKSYRKTGVQINAIQFQCKNCGGYVTRKLEPEEKEELQENGKLKSIYRNITG